MAILSAGGLSRSFGQATLFESVSFSIEAKDKVGFIGSNGAGKTTLFKIITGEDAPDSGTITLSGNITLGYMEQYLNRSLGKTVYEEALSIFDNLQNMELELIKIADMIDKGQDAAQILHRQHDLQEKYEFEGGLLYKSRTRAALMGLGFSEEELLLQCEVLSGGQKTRLSLARLLLSNADLLLLDEPTNHLDMDAIAFLEDYLISYKGAYIVISHDRYFLDKVTTSTFELENRQLKVFNGNYSKYMSFKENDREIRQHRYESELKEIRRIEGIIEQQRKWNREKNIRTAESKEKMLEKKKALLDKPETQSSAVLMDFSPVRESGFDVLKLTDIKKSFDGTVLFENANVDIKKGEKVFFLGGNGKGKTTLLNIITQRTSCDSGEIRCGAKVDIGYYEQQSSDLHGTKTVISHIRDNHPKLSDTEIRNYLAAFLIKGDDVFKQLDNLSGGERAKVALLNLMLAKPNLLILDEPTNHLDIGSREALEKALLSYPATAIIVSHDRYFVNRLATKIYTVSTCGTTEYMGNYDYYLQKYQPEKKPYSEKKEKDNSYLREKEQKSKLRKAENQLIRCEEKIEKLELIISSLEDELLKTASDYERAMELTEKISQKKEALERLYEDWEDYNLGFDDLKID